MPKKNKIGYSIIWNTVGTTFNAFNSLFFLIIVTRVNGVNDAGIFTFAFSIACLLYVIGNYSGRSYQVTEVDNDITDSDYFYTKIITSILMFIISILFCLIKKYDAYKSLIIVFLVIYKLLESVSEYLYALVQKNEELYKVGISMFLKSLISLLLFLIIDLVTKKLLLSEIIIILTNLLIILIYDVPNIKKVGLKIGKFHQKSVINLLKKGFCTFGFSFLTLYVINASKYAIDGVLSNELQTVFGIIIMPATILILFGQFIIQPFLTILKSTLEKDKKYFIKMIMKMVLTILGIGGVSLLATYLLGIPILQLLYGIPLEKYLIHLLIIIIGAIFYGITNIFSTALTTMRHTFNQLMIFIIVSLFTFFLSNYLVRYYNILGASISYLVTMLVLSILYITAFYIDIKRWKI